MPEIRKNTAASAFALPVRSREEEATAEIGHTEVSPAVARTLVAMFLLVIFGVPAVQHVYEIRQAHAGRRDHALPQAYDIFRGVAAAIGSAFDHAGSPLDRMLAANRVMMHEISRYETALEDDSVFAGAVQPSLQSLLVRIGAGNEQAYLGRDGWLFYRRDVDYVIGPGFLDVVERAKRERAADPRAAILQFRDQLAQRGITLVVFPTPVKPSVQPEKLAHSSAGRDTVMQNASYAQFVGELRDAGVLVFDGAVQLTEAKRATGADQFLIADTHWRPEAMQRVAEGLAEFVRQNVNLRPLAAPALALEEETVRNLGDVAVMLRLPADQRLFQPETVRLQRVLAPDGGLWRPAKDADVLLLGDSFSNIYSLEGMGWGVGGGLAEHLAHRLERPLDCILRNDAGAFATREILSRELARGRDRLAGKKLVIWQFAARELALGDWKILDLQLGVPPPRTFVAPQPGQTIAVTGTIEAITSAPKPGTVPYKDHIVAAHLVELQTDGRAIPGGEAIVYLWSMRDGVWTSAARFRAGQTLHVKLALWADVAGRLDRINRSELADEALQLEDPCWGELLDEP